MDVQKVLEWVDAHRDEALADLVRYCVQPSVAAQGWGMSEMAAIVEGSLRDLGAETRLLRTQGYPAILGRLDGEAPARLLIYNHYDVQPPEPLEEWDSPPFEPQVRNGHFYARGVADNKGNVVARIWAVRAWLAVHGSLPCGVTFLIEGEEEIGSPHLGDVPVEYPDAVRADACLWEAGYREDNGALALYAGLKGMLYVELHARGVAYDLHSANANLAPSAAWRLVGALQSLRDAAGHVLIPGFYDDIRPPTERERDLMSSAPVDASGLRERWGVARLLGPDDDPAALTERSLFEPTCNIAGLWSGYSGPGTKTVLPAQAAAKIDFRLVPDQDPEKILASLRAHLDATGFGDVEVVELPGTSRPAQSAVDTPLMVAMEESARLVYGVEPRVQSRMAATGPMEKLCQRHGMPAVGGAGVGHGGSRTHAPNENIRVEDFVLGIKHVAVLLEHFARAAGGGR
jgi:acetylornithine deacetylase/succinyl-diaminopimelate desuccinylase-like protein